MSSGVKRSVPSSALADALRAILVDFQPHRVALAPVVQFIFHRLEQAARVLFVKVKLAVARDAKMPVAEDFCAGKQVLQKAAHDLAQENVILPRPLPAAV